jgi:hypothetical protein
MEMKLFADVHGPRAMRRKVAAIAATAGAVIPDLTCNTSFNSKLSKKSIRGEKMQ